MAERKGFTRTGPEMTAKLLEKGEGFGTKHAGGLNASMSQWGRSGVWSAGPHTWASSVVLPALPPIQALWKPRQCVKGPECRGV